MRNPKQNLANFHIVWKLHGYKLKIATRIVGHRFLVNLKMRVFIIVPKRFLLSISNHKQGVATFHIVWKFHGYKFKIATRIVGQRFLVIFNM